MKTILLNLFVGLLVFITISCGNPSSKENYKIVYQKKFGLTKITMCLVKDTNWNELQKIGKNLVENDNLAFAFFYTDSSNIQDITKYSDAITALPGDGFVAKYTVEHGLERNLNRYVVTEKPTGPVNIILLEQKNKNSKYYWYTYYVENYSDSKETDGKMIEIAKQATYSNDGFTEVFFFNDKNNAPKLAGNGGWGDNESQNSWNKKYGKFCVGYYSVGGGNQGEFTKGWK